MTIKFDIKLWAKVAIMLLLMMIIGALPPFGEITPMGMKVLGVFVGIIFAWITMDTLWPSLFGFVALALTGSTTLLGGLAAALSNPTIIMLFVSSIFAGLLSQTNCIVIINKWLLTRKIVTKSPWFLVIALVLFQFLGAICNGGIAVILLGWEIILQLTKECGYEKKSATTSYLLAISVCVNFSTNSLFPFMQGSIAYLGFFEPVIGTSFEYLPYCVLSFACLSVFIVLMLFCGKYILKIDVSKLKITEEKVKELEKIKADPLQKASLLAVLAFVILLLAPSFLPKVWFVTELLQKLGLTGVAILIMIFFALLKDEHGKHVISLENCHNYVPWPVFWLIAFAMPLGNAIKSPDSGIMATITNFVTPLFDNVNIYVFMILAMVLVGVLTQVSNNMVLGAIFIPVFTNICIQMGGNPYVLFLMLMYSVNCAYCTPAASFQGALVHGNENVSKKYAYLIGFTALVVTWVACLVMIPLGFLFW